MIYEMQLEKDKDTVQSVFPALIGKLYRALELTNFPLPEVAA